MESYQLYKSIKRVRRGVIAFIFSFFSIVLCTGAINVSAEENVSNRELRGGVVQYAENFLGKPYVYGAEGPEAFDCSGLTKHVYKKFNVDLPHYTGTQWGCGKGICKSELREGDLVFFNTTGKLSHVGIYIGGGKFIHAASKGSEVKVNSLNENYFKDRYAGARRILK